MVVLRVFFFFFFFFFFFSSSMTVQLVDLVITLMIGLLVCCLRLSNITVINLIKV